MTNDYYHFLLDSLETFGPVVDLGLHRHTLCGLPGTILPRKAQMSGNWTCDNCGEPVNFRPPSGRFDLKSIPCPYHCGGRIHWNETQLTSLPDSDAPLTVAPHVEKQIAASGFQKMREAAEKAGL